ncbi:MAG: nickel pincer cofactor biosynthesis protein LarC, partial [Actinomycetota bacterium]|nr:nickel pincer cofactor biosynthesis protein LarC [Actinomycetota bacterium]
QPGPRVRTLYVDCFSGAAGDMLLGGLLDAGAGEAEVREAVAALGLDGCELAVRDVTRGSLRATKVDVAVTGRQERRGPSDIEALLHGAALDEEVRAFALKTFDLLAGAEAKVHGIPREQVHFHEVGAVDAIVDVVGCAAALESLAPERVVASPVTTGRGWVEAAHGPIPVPAPAVVELLKGVPMEERGTQELVTPTGAALLREAVDEFGPMPPLTVDAVGYGAGTRDTDTPNVLRVVVGETARAPGETTLLQVEANVDDTSPELLPHALEALMAAGAVDAWVTPVVMKKGRPGFVVSALVPPAERERVVDVFLRETTTFGVRMHEVERDVLDRAWVEVDVAGHSLRVKIGTRAGEVVTAAPEFEDARRVARATGIPLKDVYERALRAARATTPQ